MNVSRYRRYTGLTQEQLAKLIGISTNSYSNKERGITPFTYHEMVKIRGVFRDYFPNITMDEIFLDGNYRNYRFV
ncbi:helix-turn-helix transcriptional regulator [Tuanshanicoccus lijuaniae]|uniref:helix-turn-helix transcriptional regulator n=1 Tax=Aerococcaceae bacterium zg-1292 TaxID=2774330 RepID=UPI001936D089|nr:helix-turn-helix transcriptional regulator [Aerococcaceae bacterium zg-1292]QQA37521.1 helix-turn-helix transcriptional regulator [Aerococcaceae bacterium zg-1292]